MTASTSSATVTLKLTPTDFDLIIVTLKEQKQWLIDLSSNPDYKNLPAKHRNIDRMRVVMLDDLLRKLK